MDARGSHATLTGEGALKFGVSRHIFEDSIIARKLFVRMESKYTFLENSLHWLFKNT